MSDNKPSGIYNDIERALEAKGFTLESVTDISLSHATDGPLRATVTAIKEHTTTPGSCRGTWRIEWFTASARAERIGGPVHFGSGDYEFIED